MDKLKIACIKKWFPKKIINLYNANIGTYDKLLQDNLTAYVKKKSKKN